MSDSSISSRVVKGTAWMVAARWCTRAIGLVSTVILARLLSPADFGIVAIAMIIVGLGEVLSETGLAESIIRTKEPTDDHFNTVWTLQILLGAFIGLLLVSISSVASGYFSDSRLEVVIQILALRAVIQGFENPGVIWFRKNMDFNKDFRLMVVQKFLRFIVVIVLALILRNYWALVISLLSTKVIYVSLTYYMHPFRPRLSLSKTKEIWAYSLWMLVKHIGQFLDTKIDEIIIGGHSNTANVGKYSIAVDTAMSPTLEVTAPISRVLFSAYNRLGDNTDYLSSAFLKAFGSICIICFATGAGISLVSEDVVTVVFGAKWLGAIEPMFWIGFATIAYAMSNSMANFLSSIGGASHAAIFSWIRILILLPCLILAVQSKDLGVVGFARFAVLSGLLLPTIIYFSIVTKIAITRILRTLLKPLLAAILMSVCVIMVDVLLPNPSFFRLIMKTFIGASVYSACILAWWQLSGRPDGLETIVYRAALSVKNRLKGTGQSEAG